MVYVQLGPNKNILDLYFKMAIFGDLDNLNVQNFLLDAPDLSLPMLKTFVRV